MTTPCGNAALLLAVLLPTLTTGQSLEDRVSQARRQQARSMMDMEQSTLDSLLLEREAQNGRQGRMAPGASGRGSRAAARVSARDSLLAGPVDLAEDSTTMDSVDGRSDRNRIFGKDTVRRYEQRVFRGTDPSVFSSASGAAGRDHILGPGDEISVYLWGDKEKEYVLSLNAEGRIFLEGVGLVPLAGLPVEEAAKKLKERLARIYSGIGRGTTHLDVSLGRVGPVKVFLLGEVKVPGGYIFTGNTSVLSALYFARGPTDIGSVRNLQLTRGGKKHSLDLYQYLLKGENLSPGVLQSGDILFAPRAEILVEIEGDVGRPAVYELKASEGIRELLEFAGRPNPTAAIHKMTVQRILPGGKVEYRDLETPQVYLQGKAQAVLQDGDRVLVFKTAEETESFLTVSGPVKYPGTYSPEGVRTVKDLVAKAGGLREDAFLGRVHIVRFRPDGSSMLFAYSLDSTLADTIRIQAKDNILLYSQRDMYLPDSVEVAGAVFNPGRFEFREGMTAKDLVMQAGGFLPNHESGRLLIFRGDVRERKVEQIQLDVGPGLAKAKDNFRLQARDFVQVPEDPLWYNKEIVALSGLVMRPGKYALLSPGERLSSVIERAGGFKQSAYIEGGRFFRTKDSVGRMGVEIRRAMTNPRSKANIPLVGGDSIHIPERLNTVKVIGEVGFETSVLFREGAPVQYYIEKAGGFTRRSERDRVVVQYANGETSRDGFFNRKPDVGSVIYVPQGPEPVRVNWMAGTNAILATLSGIATLFVSILTIQALRE